MFKAVIIPTGDGKTGWNVGKARVIKFCSRKRFYTFVSYYSLKKDVLIRVIENGVWIASYVKGKEIWNIY